MASAYLEAHRSGVLERRIERGRRWLRKCSLCPRCCRVNRLEDERGYCRTGRHALVSSYGPHFGEEQPLVGRNGSGTIFFTHCNLLCQFCQNWDVSHLGHGVEGTAEQLAAVMLELQSKGCHNINFVTPSHVIVQILEALPVAIEQGLWVPLVYNCGGYDRHSALKLLDGVVDIYMPDFKFWDPQVAGELCDAPDYPRYARGALEEMHRQVGDLKLDEEGVAQRGLLVRHLVMPNDLAGTREVMGFISEHISNDTYVNVMKQYRPCGKAVGHPKIGRGVTDQEFAQALSVAREQGVTRLDKRRPTFVLW